MGLVPPWITLNVEGDLGHHRRTQKNNRDFPIYLCVLAEVCTLRVLLLKYLIDAFHICSVALESHRMFVSSTLTLSGFALPTF